MATITSMPKKEDYGLARQIRYTEDCIAIKKELGKASSFEEGLVKEWRRYLPGGDKHYLWVAYSQAAAAAEKAVSAPRVDF